MSVDNRSEFEEQPVDSQSAISQREPELARCAISD